jgi:predicted RNA-binding protein with EMAP domain
MSGGSFNYLYLKVDDMGSNTSLYEILGEATRMEQRLRSERKHDAADEILTYVLFLETTIRRLEKRGKHVSDLMQAVEMWQSCDWGPERVDKALEKMLGGDE